MTTLELLERYGRRFAILNFGEKSYFDFYEVVVNRKREIVVKNTKVTATGKIVWPNIGEELTINEVADILRNHYKDEIFSLVRAGELDEMKEFARLSEELARHWLRGKASDSNAVKLQERLGEIYLELARNFAPRHQPPTPKESLRSLLFP